MPNEARFLDFMDMIDGGGAGRMGDKFEGGGIFSALANMIATPYGSEDEERRKSREAAYRAAGLLAMEPPKEPTVIRTGDGRPTPTKPSPEQLASARMAELERQRGLQQDVFDPRDQQGASSFTNPMSGYPDMSMPAIAGYTTPAPAPAPVTSDPRNFAPNTQPSVISDAQKEAMVMRQSVIPMGNTEVNFGPPATPSPMLDQRQQTPSPMLDQRQQAPSPDEARALQAIADNNMMDRFINLPPYQQRAMIETMLQRGY